MLLTPTPSSVKATTLSFISSNEASSSPFSPLVTEPNGNTFTKASFLIISNHRIGEFYE